MNRGKFTVRQLKETLAQIGLSQKDTKQELLKRLYEYDPTGGWKVTAQGILSETMPDEDEEATLHTVADDSEEEGRAAAVEIQQQVPAWDLENVVSNVHRETDLRNKEIEILRRERDLTRRELELLRLETRIEVTSGSNVPSTTYTGQTTGRPQIKALAELLSEFSGEEDTFWKWRRQYELIRTSYHLDDREARILVSMRLKQKALQWFHSNLGDIRGRIN